MAGGIDLLENSTYIDGFLYKLLESRSNIYRGYHYKLSKSS